jgi:hypothetical protein
VLKIITADWDGAWKDSVLGLFPWFLALFFPKVYVDIDWSRGFETLDKEFQKLAPDAGTGVRTVDLLFKVWRRNGEEQWVLIHIEVQAQRIVGLPKRIFVYNGRASDRYGVPVVSFVVLADDEPGWRPRPYVFELWGFRNECCYPTVKLLDFADRIAELETSDNPFAVVTLAHLTARETTGDWKRRREWKARLLTGLYNRGWERKDIQQLLRSIDWFLKLPREDDRWVREVIEADEKEKNVPYITSFEQMAMEEGEIRGRAEGLRDGIALALRSKFGDAGQKLMAEVTQVHDIERLKRMMAAIMIATTLEDARQDFLG